MKISVKEKNGKAFSIKFPNWLILNRLGISLIVNAILKEEKIGISVAFEKEGADIAEQELSQKKSKKIAKEQRKRLKKGFFSALGELRAFLKRNRDFVLVDTVDSDGDHTEITL